MWLVLIVLYGFVINPTSGHIPSYVTTPATKVEQHCSLADSCIHDTIPICGKGGDEIRTFLDLCDMFEYTCDTDTVFVHIEDNKDCPKARVNP